MACASTYPPGTHAERKLRVFLQIEDRQILPGECQSHRPAIMFNGDPPGCGSFVGVGWADDQHIGDRTQTQQLLDRFVGRAVLSQGDAVMRKDVDHVQPHQGGQADGRAHVIREDQESSSKRKRAPMRCHPVQDRPHGVFADTEMKIVPGVLPAASD